MKVANVGNSFALERTDDPEFPYLRIAATVETSRGKFVGENNAVFFGGGDEGQVQFERFKDFAANEVRIELTEGCRIDLKRFPRGNLELRFNIEVVGHGVPTSMHGLIPIEGEYSQQAIVELWNIIAQ